MSRTADPRPVGWNIAAALVFLAAGVLFATSRRTARGTELRSRRISLAEVAVDKQRIVSRRAAAVTRLQRDVARQTAAAAERDSGVRAVQQAGSGLSAPAGLQGVRGPGLRVALDDAARVSRGTGPGDPTPDDLVVHEEDVVGVINALWAGGAEAMTVMNKRVISTTTVRCVGNTLFLQDEVFSPPFVVTAVGDSARMRAALDAAQPVIVFRQAVRAWGLGLDVSAEDDLALPAYRGPLSLMYARPAGS
ncbi:MAG: DUF881 domain-containing protein [Mycobacteriales bacterium]